jgi:hypothetical protein
VRNKATLRKASGSEKVSSGAGSKATSALGSAAAVQHEAHTLHVSTLGFAALASALGPEPVTADESAW